MARIKFGPIVADISGSIGSATFQKNLYGTTLRNRPRNTKSGTSSQFRSKSVMMACQYAWQNLSNEQRRQWNQFVAFSGQSINRDRGILTTGHSLYLKYNYARLLRGLSVINSTIYLSAPPWPSVLSLKLEGTYLHIYFSASLDTLNIYPSVFLSPRRVASRAYSPQGLRFILDTANFGDHYVYNYVYLNIFGRQLEIGDIVSCKVQFWSRTAPIMSSIQTGLLTVIAY